MTTWLFVRHAESVANAEGWLAGQRDAPLTAEGRRRARKLGAILSSRHFDRVFASDLSRARDTARLLVGDRVPIVEVPALRERALGAWEGQRRAALTDDGRLARLLDWKGRPPGGESLADVARRMIDWLATVPDDGLSLVVAHGAILRATLTRLDGLPDALAGTWALRNLDHLERTVAQATWGQLARDLAAPAPPDRPGSMT